jgi:Ca2+-transporting ATPase
LVRPVHSAVPGRVRFEIEGLHRDDALARMLPGRLARRSGILSASASSLTGKLLVLFDPGLDPAQVQSSVEEALSRPTRGSRGSQARNGTAAGPNDRASIADGEPLTWHRLPARQALGQLDSSPETGLGQAEAA